MKPINAFLPIRKDDGALGYIADEDGKSYIYSLISEAHLLHDTWKEVEVVIRTAEDDAKRSEALRVLAALLKDHFFSIHFNTVPLTPEIERALKVAKEAEADGSKK